MFVRPTYTNTFTWDIPKFSECTQKANAKFTSRIFHTKDLYQTEWRIHFGVSGREDKHAISVYFNRCDTESDKAPNDLYLNCTVCFLNGEEEHYKKYLKANFRKNRIRGFTNFVERNAIIERWSRLLKNDTLTVQCCLGKCEYDEFMTPIIRFQADIELERPIFLWNVNFNGLGLRSRARTTFLSDVADGGFELSAMLDSEESDDGLKDVFIIDIAPLTYYHKQMFMHATISVLDNRNRPSIVFKNWHVFEADCKIPWHFAKIDKSKLTGDSLNIWRDGTLNLNCDITVGDDKKVAETRQRLKPLVEVICDDQKTLHKDILSTYEREDFSDIVLKVGNEEFWAHRLILSARSPVFRELLKKTTDKHRRLESEPLVDAASESVSNVEAKNRQKVHPNCSSHTDSEPNVPKKVVRKKRDLKLNSASNSVLNAKETADGKEHWNLFLNDFERSFDNFVEGINESNHDQGLLSEYLDVGSDIALVDDSTMDLDKVSPIQRSRNFIYNDTENENTDNDETLQSPRSFVSSNITLHISNDVQEGDRTGATNKMKRSSKGSSSSGAGDDAFSTDYSSMPRSSLLISDDSSGDDDDAICEVLGNVPHSSPNNIPNVTLDSSLGNLNLSEVQESSHGISVRMTDDLLVAEMTGISSQTLRQMLQCMYTDRVDNMHLQNCLCLLLAAQNYKFEFLVDKCHAFLKSSISVKNFAYLMATAVHLSIENLENAVLNFLLSKKDTILLSKEWEDFSTRQTELAARAMQFLRSQTLNQD